MGRLTFNRPQDQGLYAFANEHDACGVGFVANIDGEKSHAIVEKGVEVLRRLQHRGAAGGDPDTGDGAGMLMQTPDKFFRSPGRLGFDLPAPGSYAVGMFFLPQDRALEMECVSIAEGCCAKEGFSLLGWRDVPVDPSSIGALARATCPRIKQLFVASRAPMADLDAFERRVYILRKVIENTVDERMGAGDDFYIASLSSRTIVYKGLLMAPQLPAFYLDLGDPEFESALAIVHQRYSTNTFPTWPLAHPFRLLAHNGEINTLRGNINQMRAREKSFHSDLFGADVRKLAPVIREGQSDSACLDNALELLVAAGRSLPHAAMMLVPQAWGQDYSMGRDLRGFFDYHSGLMEPWDGPAALAFSDGRSVGAMLDRNGLRPARFTITSDRFMVLASEAGVLDIPPEKVRRKGCLRPGQMIFVDLERRRVMFDGEIKTSVARRQPYRRWVEENRINLEGLFSSIVPARVDKDDLWRRQTLFGYTREDLNVILKSMAETGHEPTSSMGNDAALAILSEKPQLLFSYFKQLFAQVTNPAIDPIREKLVMSLMTFIGNQGNILSEKPQHARLLKLRQPILTDEDVERIRNSRIPDFKVATVTYGFHSAPDGGDIEAAVERFVQEVESKVREGHSVIILSDRRLPEGETPMPSLLAVSAANHHLIRLGLRTSTGLIVETGEAREVMHFALLLGYSATAVNPYLAYETLMDMVDRGHIDPKIGKAKAMENYIGAIGEGLLKVMSKMGISTLRSYRGAQVFEAVGLDKAVVDKYFTWTASRIGGIGLKEIAAETHRRREASRFPDPFAPKLLDVGGNIHWRHGGEKHLWTPDSISKLQQAVRSGDFKAYQEYAALINDQARHLCTLRGLFKFKARKPIPVEEVEPASEIVKRFVTGAMSFGSISREAHEALAIAMNRLGGMSNSGEGGEDPARYKPLPNGDSLCSAIKQVASGRFGVTAEYLAHARELQIKICQGAKPGEGGQLPGHKVDKIIARVRHSTPGVTLISPPPHHDIYSIEDLAQLIFDLKNSNPGARVSVKLVSEIGVGTVAAGVAKGYADMVLISGHDGGTGASPLSSIKHAGLPWELGLAETQQTLVLNKLRDRIRVQCDGQMKTGRDVVIGALLGAEEFGFATAALVSLGCVMMRKCHVNTCPVGIATQDAELRKRFAGKPEHVQNFLMFVAEEARQLLASLGLRSMDEAVGRSDLLEMNDAISFWKAKNLDFSAIFAKPADETLPVRRTAGQPDATARMFDRRLLDLVGDAIETKARVQAELPISNVDRTAGALLSYHIARRHGNAGLPEDTFDFTFRGCAGQSFGAFLARGVRFTLIGEANDYVGKGLSGGRLVIRPPETAAYVAAENIIVGNVCFYGATGGDAYIHGQAGERFGIRNSGARLVVEGVGDHCCEYMTGGRVVVLGRTGVNFAAGMSGGIAYVYDELNQFDQLCNLSMVDLEPLVLDGDIAELRKMIEDHAALTGSPKAAAILRDWEDSVPKFVKVFPMEYRKVLGQMSKDDLRVERQEPQRD